MKKGYDLGPFTHLQLHKTHFQSYKDSSPQGVNKSDGILGWYWAGWQSDHDQKKCGRQGSGPTSDVDFWWDYDASPVSG